MSYSDLQVNGYAGVDFNQDDLDAESLHRACKAIQADRVGGILVAIITEDVEKMVARIRRIAELRRQDSLIAEIVAGSHLLGSAMSMPQAVKNLSEKLGRSAEEIESLTATRPRMAIACPEFEAISGQ